MTGELVVEEQTAHLDTLERLETFAPVFRHLPDRDHAPDPRWLDSATIVTATPANPQAPVQHYLETVREFEAVLPKLDDRRRALFGLVQSDKRRWPTGAND